MTPKAGALDSLEFAQTDINASDEDEKLEIFGYGAKNSLREDRF